MAVTQVNYTGNGSTTNYSFTFPYLDKTDVKVRIDGTIQDTTAYSFANATTIAMASAPASGAKVVILRDTNVDSKKATFYAGSAIKSEDLNDNYDQVLYTVQEIDNNAMTTDGTTPMTGDLALGEDLSIVFEGATDNAYETTLTVADPTADRTITLPNETGTVITSAGTDVIDSAHYVAGSIDLEHMSANSVDSDQYVDGSINGVHISNDAIDSQHYAAGSIDLEHMSANSVDSDQYVDGSIDLVHMSANSVDSDQYVDGSIDRVHLSADIIDGTKIADDAIASEHIADNAINNSAMLSGAIVGTGQIINDAIVSSKIADDVIDSEHYAAGSIDTEHIGDNQVTIDKIDDGVIVLNSEQAGHTVNDTSFFTTSASDTRYFRQTSAETILDGATWTSSDAYIATTAAIDDRIVDLVDDVGGFVPIDNETSFPNANPDVNNGAGTLVSIKALASAFTSNGSGVATIANGTVGNSTVTINGLDNSTTYAAGFGMIVETTTTLNTYKFHRTTPKATEVTTVAGSIANVNTVATNIATVNDFADKYRIASSAPGSNNDDGDLYYNTSDNKLYVYDGSAWGVAASLNGSGGTITGNITFNDNVKGQFGTGNDLEIYHDGSHSIVSDSGTGQLRLTGSNVVLRTAAYGEVYQVCTENGSVDLYYDNVKKFETTSAGVTVTGGLIKDGSNDPIVSNQPSGGNAANPGLQIKNDGTINGSWRYDGRLEIGGQDSDAEIKLDPAGNIYILTDSGKLQIGAGQDLQIYHNGSHSIINNNTGSLLVNADNITFQSADAGETIARFLDEGACELWFNNSKKFETTSDGVKLGDGVKLNFNTKSYIWDNSSNTDTYWMNPADNTDIDVATAGKQIKLTAKDTAEAMLIATADGAVDLYFDGGKKFETKSDGVKLSQGHFYADDHSRIKLGDGPDLEIYHDGTNNYIKGATASQHVIIEANSSEIQLRPVSGEYALKAVANGAVELYYDNVKKAYTYSNGLACTANLSFVDDGKAVFGSGNDIEIWSSGSIGHIKTQNDDLRIQSPRLSVLNVAADEQLAEFYQNAQVELYYDNVKKFNTSSSGAQVHGHLFFDDDHIIKLGSSQDLQIYHTGNYGLIEDASSAGLVVRNTNANVFIQSNEDIRIGKNGMSESYIECKNDDAVELYYDNSKKLETLSSGVLITGNCLLYDNHAAKFGTSQDLVIYHDGSHSYIEEGGTGDLIIDSSHIVFKDGGTQVLETVNTGIRLDDDKKIYLGTGSDLSVYHSGNHAFNINSTGTYYIHSDAYQFNCADNAENLITANEGGSVSLYYDGSMKFRTMSGACEITGHCQPSADANGTNIGQSSLRWTNIFASNAPINTSDRNEKNTIQDCDLGLSFIDKLKPVSYKWNNKEAGTKTNYGLIAQDLLEVIEEEGKSLDDFGPIHKEEGSAYGLNYTQLISPLIKAVQELSARVAELEAK